MKATKEDGGQLELIQKFTTSMGGAAGVLVLVYAIAYLLGFQHLRNYFRDIGAPWALGLFGPMDIIQAPSAFAAIILTILVQFAVNTDIVKQATLGFSVFAGLIAAGCFAIHLAVEKLMHGYSSYWIIPALLAGVPATISLIAFLFRIATEKEGLFAGTISFGLLMLALVFIGIPMNSDFLAKGKIKSIREGELPIDIKGEAVKGWQLVRAMPNNQLLIARVRPDEKISFRLVSATEAIAVESTK